MKNKKIGDFGEKIAQKYLKQKSYKILETNIKLSYKELDIIARKNNKIIFIEVKTRTSNFMGDPEDEMNSRKLNHLKTAIAMYMGKHKEYDPNEVRLDLIAIKINQNTQIAKIKHYKDIF